MSASEELKGDDTLRAGRGNPARQPYRPAVPRLRRGPRHRRRHHRRRGHRRLHRQCRAEDRRGRAEADQRPAAPGVHQQYRRRKIAYLLARPGLDRLREWLDPRRYNGAVMVGLNGVVVKSHGGTDAKGFAHAVDVAMDMVVHRFNDHIREDLARIGLDKRSGADKNDGTTAVARLRDRLTLLHSQLDTRCPSVPFSPASAAICPSASSPMTNWRAPSIPPTSGSASAPASASATSPARTRPRRSWAPRRRGRRWPHAGAEPGDVDAIILATSTPDQAFPATALRVQAALGVTRRLRLRPVGGLRRVHLRAVGRGRHDPRRPGARGAGDRQRGLLAHPELAGPRHLRAVRRRRRRGVPARRRGAAAPIDRGILSTHLHAQGTLGDILYVDGAVGQPRQAGPPGDERARGVPPCGHPAGRGGGRGAGRQWPDTARHRLAGAAPGQPADHRRDGQANWAWRTSAWW